MTTTFNTSQRSVPTAAEIAFSALRRNAFLVVRGDAGADTVDTIVHTVGPGEVCVAAVPPGFGTMDGMAQLFAALLPVVQREAPDLVTAEQLESGLFTMNPYRARKVGVGYLAESVTFAVTRRISRESHQSALIIDAAARTLLAILRGCPTFARGMTVHVADLHRWDRPSLRCLYRLVLLAEESDRLTVVGCAPPSGGEVDADDPVTRIGAARERFLTRLAATGVVRMLDGADVAGAGGAGTRHEPEDGLPDRYDELLLAMGDALVFQNYERVFHLGRYALDRAADGEQEAQARRLIGIADTQLEDFASAGHNLERAAALTTDVPFAAHLHYLRGLIATKRQYDLETADDFYARGQRLLEVPPGGGDPVGWRIERAWIHNGRALVNALRAKGLADVTARERLIADAFDLELRAFALVRGVPGAAPAYLRHNLMANLTFLLEISGRFTEAVRFWRGAFEAYLASDSKVFQVTFDARLGVLLVRAGETEEGIRLLQNSRAVAHETGDRFAEEEVCLKLAYAYDANGELGRAFDAYAASLRIAHELREADICVEALSGMLWALADEGQRDGFAALRDAVIDALPGTDLAAKLRGRPDPDDPPGLLRAAGVRKPMPSPKLRAYIPGVDLEGTPTQDLNRYLAWGGDTRGE